MSKKLVLLTIQFVVLTQLYMLPICVNATSAVRQTKHIEQGNSKQQISGKVVDSDGNPLIGVSVRSHTGNILAITDMDGIFHLTLSSNDRSVEIEISYIGMESQKVTLHKPFKNIVIRLKEQLNLLDEVVTTGYNKILKRRTAGSFTEITKDKIENQVSTSIDKILQGQVAGVSITVPNGRPGETAKVRIRGVNTIQGNAEPLWVVDGVVVQDNLPKINNTGKISDKDFNDIFRNGIGDINPNDIESVTILKDAVATAIYGSRSAGGVIVVTTKHGKEGKPRVSYSNQFTLSIHPQRQENLMNASEKIDWEQELWNEFSAPNYASGNGWVPIVGIVGMVNADKIGKGGKVWSQEGFEPMTTDEKKNYLKQLKMNGVNWYDEIFRNAFSQTHNFSLSGGSQKMDYYTSIGYTNNRGLVKNTDYDRYSFNMKVNAQLNPRLKVSFKSSVAYQVSDGYVSSVDPFKYAYFANPYETPYQADGSYRPDMTYYNLTLINAGDVTPDVVPANGFNILREMNETHSHNTKLGLNLQGQFDWFILSSLKLTGLYAHGINEIRSTDEMNKDTYAAFNSRLTWDTNNKNWADYGVLRQSFNHGSNYTARLMLNYTQDFKRMHHFSAIAGSEVRSAKNERALMMQYGYDPETKITGMPEPPAETMSDREWVQLIDGLTSSQWDENKYASFFGTLDYNFNNTYTLNVAFRTDGSNNFGSKEQFNPTWSVGAAWNVDNEKFWKPIRPIVNRFTIRAAYGFTGNVVQGILKSLIIEKKIKKWKGHPTGSVQTAPNPHLRWERTRDMKLGVDLGLLDDRLNINAEVYEKLGSDIITRVGTVSTMGFTTQSFNTSTIRNRGVELSISGTAIKNNDFSLSTAVNLAWNRNELVKYVAPFFGISDGKYEGFPIDAIFNGIPMGLSPKTGLYELKTIPGAKLETPRDLRKVANYQFYLGTRNAPYTGGGNLQMSYRGFTLNMYASYSIGAKVMDDIPSPVNYYKIGYSRNNEPQTDFSDLYTNHLNVTRDRINRWTEQNHEGVKYPRIVDAFGSALNLDDNTVTGTNVINGIYLRNVSYLRLRNVSLSYRFKPTLIAPLGLSSLGVTCSAQNLLTFTNYPGIDPEQPGLTYPVTRSFTFGLQLGF